MDKVLITPDNFEGCLEGERFVLDLDELLYFAPYEDVRIKIVCEHNLRFLEFANSKNRDDALKTLDYIVGNYFLCFIRWELWRNHLKTLT